MSTCPACGANGAYVGMTSVECANATCVHGRRMLRHNLPKDTTSVYAGVPRGAPRLKLLEWSTCDSQEFVPAPEEAGEQPTTDLIWWPKHTPVVRLRAIDEVELGVEVWHGQPREVTKSTISLSKGEVIHFETEQA